MGFCRLSRCPACCSAGGSVGSSSGLVGSFVFLRGGGQRRPHGWLAVAVAQVPFVLCYCCPCSSNRPQGAGGEGDSPFPTHTNGQCRPRGAGVSGACGESGGSGGSGERRHLGGHMSLLGCITASSIGRARSRCPALRRSTLSAMPFYNTRVCVCVFQLKKNPIMVRTYMYCQSDL